MEPEEAVTPSSDPPKREPEPATAMAIQTQRSRAATQSKPKPTPPPRSLAARARIADLRVAGSLVTSVVRRAIERRGPDYLECYRAAAQAAGRNSFGPLSVKIEIDHHGRSSSSNVGKHPLPGLSACVRKAARRVVTRRKPDTGTVTATFRLVYAP